MTEAPAIAVLLLDADGVVQHPVEGWLAELATLRGPGFHQGEFLDAIFAAEQPSLTGQEDFAIALAATLQDFASPISAVDALKMWTRIQPVAEIFALLADVRVPVCLASNQQEYRARHMATGLNYAEKFEQLFFSCELGCRKPEPAFFQTITRCLRQEPAELLFIDDHQSNVAAARDCGLNAEHFDLTSGADRLVAILNSYQLLDPGPLMTE